MMKRNSALGMGALLLLLFFTTLWLSAEPKNSAEQVFEEIDQMRPESILLLPPQGQAQNFTEDQEAILKFFRGETPGRLFLLGRRDSVMEVSFLDGKWSVVRVDGSQMTIDQESFKKEFAKLIERSRIQGQYTACMSNMKNLATGLEMYSTDYGGRYPTPEAGLGILTPNYLRELPDCPAAEKMTYSYACGPDAELNGPGYNDYYEMRCVGANHKAAGAEGDLPVYTGIVGLINTAEGLAEEIERAKKEREERDK